MSNIKGIKTDADTMQGAVEALRRYAPMVAESIRVLYDQFQAQGFSHEDSLWMATDIFKKAD